MIALASVSPLLFVVGLSAVWRRPAFVSAWCGVAVVIALILLLPAMHPPADRLVSGLGAAGLITTQALCVILPGLLLNELIGAAHTNDRLVAWVGQIPMRPAHKVILIVVGLAPALESLTGFGVSLLVTVPLLLAPGPRGAARRQAMLGMNIMPWGTLGLATVVGAQLGHQDLGALGLQTAVVSGAIFPALGLAAAWLAAPRGERLAAALQGALAGAVLSAVLIAINRAGIVELGGILAGLGSCAACLLLFGRRGVSGPPPWPALAPYGVVLGLVLVIRTLPAVGVPLSSVVITAGGVHFLPLASPGLALLVAALVFARGRPDRRAVHAALQRGSRPLLALAGFTVMAQLMVASGMVRAVGSALPASGSAALAPMSAVLGVASGYLTGSNVGGNALMMTLQANLVPDHSLIFAALQNSAAGHAVFASMPIVLLVLAISGGARPGEEAGMIRFGLSMAALIAAIVAIAGSLMLLAG